jgi:putative Mn2+ efflux pump MntP
MNNFTTYILAGAIISFIGFRIAIKQMNQDEDDKAEFELIALSMGLSFEKMMLILYIITVFSWPVFVITIIIKKSRKDEPPME